MIFYFSATGNSLQTAKRLKKEFGGELISMADAVRHENFTYEIGDGEKAFFVMPVYFWGLPSIVRDFLLKLSLKGQEIQICGILTCGASAGAADRMFLKLMKPKNGEVKGVYTVKLPDNFILAFPAPNPEAKIMQLRRGEKELEEIIEDIQYNFRAATYAGPGKRILSGISYAMYNRLRRTKKFRVSDNCIGCGLCQTVCPSDMITMEDGKPVWKDGKCTWCLGCINRCPVEAIQYGNRTEDKGRYVHPALK